MRLDTHRTMKPLKDEDLWVGLRKTQWLAVFIGLAFAWGAYKLILPLSSIAFTICVTYIIMLTVFAMFFKIPPDLYQYGTGLSAPQLVFRVLYRFFHRRIYMQNHPSRKEKDTWSILLKSFRRF